MNDFWESTLESGYYDKVLSEGLKKNKGIQPNWHNITFLHIKKYIKNNHKHLDFACGPGTFIGRYVTAQSIGVDIASAQIEYAKIYMEIKETLLQPKHSNHQRIMNILM